MRCDYFTYLVVQRAIMMIVRHYADLADLIVLTEAADVLLSHWTSGPRLNIKTVLSTYGDFHVKDKTAVRTSYL